LGVHVHLNNRGIPAEESEQLLERLQGHLQLKNWIKEAEFVTILTMNRSGYSTFIGIDFYKGCPSAEYEIILEDIIEEILALHGGNPLIVRLIEQYKFPGTTSYAMDYYSDRGACFEQYNHSTHAFAEKYNLIVAPLFEAFSGPTEADIPDEKWYLDDGQHLSSEGDIVIADRIRDLGYEPLIP